MKLTTRIQKCKKCDELSQHRTNVVIGEGPIPCSIVFLGEAPGRKEDESGIPFCGMAGDILATSAFRCKLKRNEHYHILNVLKCRPPDNRDPHLNEYQNCIPFLSRQLKAVNPKVVVAFGRYAQAFVLNESPNKIGVLTNMGQVIKHPDFYAILSCHPAYIARNPQVLNAFRRHLRLAKTLSEGRIPTRCTVKIAD